MPSSLSISSLIYLSEKNHNQININMAPHLEEESSTINANYDNEELFVMKELSATDYPDYDCGDENDDYNKDCQHHQQQQHEQHQPASILRQPKLALSENNVDDDADASSIMPYFWSSSSNSSVVHFSANVVTLIEFRPITNILDVPNLYYSYHDVKRFKREYKQLLRTQNLTRERMLANSRRAVVVEEQNDSPVVDDENDGAPSRNTSSHTGGINFHAKNSDDYIRDQHEQSCDEPADLHSDNNGDELSGGIFSSVYDVAASLWNGTPSSYYSFTPSSPSSSASPCSSGSSPSRRPRRLSQTSTHLVDTLYLF